MTKDKYCLPNIDTLELFPIINKSLFELLRELNLSQWNKETVLPKEGLIKLFNKNCS